MTGDGNSRKNAEAIRTFVCIHIPQSMKERIRLLQDQLRQVDAQASWVKTANIHLTLKFLGDVPQAKIPQVVGAVERAIGSCSPFQVTVSGAGCFPSSQNPTVLWVGLDKIPEALMRLREAIEDELAQEGFHREPKKFKPHLTLARIRTPQNAARLAEALLAKGFAEESFTATEIIVMRSELSPQGSIYTPQAIFRLAD
jgi:2'-5' RNA ligase